MYREQLVDGPVVVDADLVPEIMATEQEFIEIRRQIHATPEIGFDVEQTASLIANLLNEWGYEVHKGIGKTGVVAQLKIGTGERKLGIRADMDALPILEKTGLAYSSTHSGKMHACGHDGHTAILLAAARHLARSRAFDGTLNLIFQPDEENLCGAKRMIEDGLFEHFPCDAVYALHNRPGLPVGHFDIGTGVVSAASDIATITLTGVGGHGAMPERTRDPIVAAGSLIMALQTIVSRNLAADDIGVVSIGAIQSGSTHNVIPDTVKILLNMRSKSAAVRKRIEARVKEIVTSQANSFGVRVDVDYANLVPSVVNAEEPTAVALKVLTRLVGVDRLHLSSKGTMGSEDFAWMCEAVPGCYVAIGNGVGQWGGCGVHSPQYDFNDNIIGLGASYWGRLAETYLTQAL